MVAAIACSMLNNQDKSQIIQIEVTVSAANTVSEKTGDVSTELVKQIL